MRVPATDPNDNRPTELRAFNALWLTILIRSLLSLSDAIDCSSSELLLGRASISFGVPPDPAIARYNRVAKSSPLKIALAESLGSTKPAYLWPVDHQF